MDEVMLKTGLLPDEKEDMTPVVCSHRDCARLATHKIFYKAAGGRAAGTPVELWVCGEHIHRQNGRRRWGLLSRLHGRLKPT